MQYYEAGVLWHYLLAFSLEILVLALVTLYFWGDKTFHMHHYGFGMMVIANLGF